MVCDGHTCTPNTLLHDGGTFAAHGDLSSLGVADRWADLAVTTWCLGWNDWLTVRPARHWWSVVARVVSTRAVYG